MADDKDQQKAERRAQIIEAAKVLFAQRGYHSASVSDIIERAQIARGTFYLYFDGKAAVFDAVLDGAMAALRGMVNRIDVSPGAPPPPVQLRQQLMALLDYVLRDDALAVVLLDSAANQGEAAQRLNQFFLDVKGLITRALTVGQAIGLVRTMSEHEVAVTSAALLGMVRGVVKFEREGGASVGATVDVLIRLALSGILARKAN